MTARWTTEPREAVTEETAIEIAPELPLDEARVAFSVPPMTPFEECLEVLAHDSVQDALLRLAASIPGGQRGGGGSGMPLVGECRARVGHGRLGAA
jgi:hypothetical protein